MYKGNEAYRVLRGVAKRYRVDFGVFTDFSELDCDSDCYSMDGWQTAMHNPNNHQEQHWEMARNYSEALIGSRGMRRDYFKWKQTYIENFFQKWWEAAHNYSDPALPRVHEWGKFHAPD